MDASIRHKLVIRLLDGRLAVVRLGPDAAVPTWAWRGSLAAVVRTPDELSIVCDEAAVPQEAQAERGWAVLVLRGPLPFSMTGVLSSVLEPLAAAQVPVFVLSTFDTDCVLVQADQLGQALQALARAGHTCRGAGD